MIQDNNKINPDAQSLQMAVMPRLYVMMFSGRRTSAVLAKHIKSNPDKYQNVIYVFLNTGKEDEKTLQFVDKCDKEWDLNIYWLEANVFEQNGEGTSFYRTTFENASRNGEPFEAMLKKYPLPNNMASNCTRELKQRPIDAFIRFIKTGSYTGYEVVKIIGIRADEAHRKSIHAKQENIIYPLCDEIPFNERMVRMFWEKQSFDLGLKDYEGNCDLCFKKSLKKRLTIIKENPEKAKWWLEMEQKYSSEKIPRFDLRTNKSIEELVEMAQRPFTKAQDLHELSQQQCDLFDFETDCFCKAS